MEFTKENTEIQSLQEGRVAEIIKHCQEIKISDAIPDVSPSDVTPYIDLTKKKTKEEIHKKEGDKRTMKSKEEGDKEDKKVTKIVSKKIVKRTNPRSPKSIGSFDPKNIFKYGPWVYEMQIPGTYSPNHYSSFFPGPSATDGYNLYLVNKYTNIYKIDPTGTVTDNYPTSYGSQPVNIIYDGANLWMIVEYNTDPVTRSLELMRCCDGAILTQVFPTYSTWNLQNLCTDGKNIYWTDSGYTPISPGYLYANNKTDGGAPYGLSAQYPKAYPNPSLMCWDGSYLWMLCGTNNNVLYQINTATGVTINTITMLFPVTAMCTDGTYIWFAMGTSGCQIGNVNISTRVVTITYGWSDSRSVSSIALDGTHIWTTDTASNVTVFSSDGTTVLNQFPTGPYPEYLSFDGTNMWSAVTGSGQNWITRYTL